MTEIWEHQQLPRSEVEKMRQEANQANTQLDEARRQITTGKTPDPDIPKG